MSQGRYFAHEHPWMAKSWYLPEIDEITKMPGVRVVLGNMCRFGTAAGDTASGQVRPVNKPTGFMTNSWCVAEELGKVGAGDRRVAAASIYPQKLARLC